MLIDRVALKFLAWMLFQDEIEEFKQNFIYPTIFNTEKDDKSYPWLLMLHELVELLIIL